MAEPERERIGLLFVHGVGEQQRWDHLRSSVHEFAELMRRVEPPSSVTVTDRIAEWKPGPGEPHPDGVAPMTLTFTSSKRVTVFECHEVWWADLGARSGIADMITFWLWGLGQWSAPIYREVDFTRQPKKEEQFGKPTSTYSTLPKSVAGDLLREPSARLQLLMAALAAMFIACTWSLAKRLFASLLGQAPSPTLIVQYVGDVRTYESRAAPGDTAPTDPGHPRRVGIRRRMVAHMVEVATAGHDGWYVLGHSLGSVVAYNGLTEIGHTLPNYLSQAQWERLPGVYKTDPGCERRKDGEIPLMMPSRPPWLGNQDLINRPLLFARLRGLLTYGSPLDKFAGLWPRIVATATDREQAGESPFPVAAGADPGCRWINLSCPSDPVSGCLDSFDLDRFENALPRVENVNTPWSIQYGLSHIRYFRPVERTSNSTRTRQKIDVTQWLLKPDTTITPHQPDPLTWLFGVRIAYPLLLAALWLAAGALVAGAGGLIQVVTGGDARRFDDLSSFREALVATLVALLAGAMVIALLFGLYRWARESGLNKGLAQTDQSNDANPESAAYWASVVWMLKAQTIGGSIMFALALLLLGGALAADLLGDDWLPPLPLRGWWTLIVASALFPLAMLLQTLLNRIVPPATPR